MFVNHPIAEMFEIIQQLELTHIQLHGDETEETIQTIKQRLPSLVIWKVIKVKSDLSTDIKKMLEHSKADHFLLDKDAGSQVGGAGIPFNWESIQSNLDSQSISKKIILAGGINFENVQKAVAQNAFCIDINSGVESSPAIKDETKIKQIMQSLRA
ncbi:MAG: phosphoribosylanthranilate isomerase [Enterobacterales bacterium]|nr:phosphoribosylanthranilate isomerase [Enterobacterales bacterium]